MLCNKFLERTIYMAPPRHLLGSLTKEHETCHADLISRLILI
jgi:hypothetical protein